MVNRFTVRSVFLDEPCYFKKYYTCGREERQVLRSLGDYMGLSELLGHL